MGKVGWPAKPPADPRPAVVLAALPMQRTPASTLAGIFCLGVSITLFQIALARVVAILVQDRFSGPVITIGLLGFGAAGCLLAVTRFGEPPGAAQRALVWVSCLYGIAVVSALRLLIALPVDGNLLFHACQLSGHVEMSHLPLFALLDNTDYFLVELGLCHLFSRDVVVNFVFQRAQ